MIAFDTNLLVYAHYPSAPEHRAAWRAIERACSDPRGWGIALSSVAEFWSVVTSPAVRAGPAPEQQARDYLQALIVDAGALVWALPEESWRRLLQMAADLEVQGSRIFDLQIALAAFENGATEIWTHDRNFASLPGLLVRDPL